MLVSFDADICFLHVTDSEGHDISEKIGNMLNTELHQDYKITAGIDSYFVEVPLNVLSKILHEISTSLSM